MTLLRLGLATCLIVCPLTVPPAAAQAVLETFEAPLASWPVQRDVAGSGAVTRSEARAASGAASARLTTGSSGARAAIGTPLGSFADAVGAHQWEERPGTWRWQRARLFVPAATVANLGTSDYVTIAQFWASAASGFGWAVRVRQHGALSVVGHRHDTGAAIEFPVFATVPVDRWIDLEIGLHSQLGPGVKRGFAFLLDGQFYGWYHQGRMESETYDRSAIGLVETNAAASLEAFVDDWGAAGTTALPTGTDLRPTGPLQEQDYRTQNGAMWQIDWSTWANDLRMDPVQGLYSNVSRFQSGRNLDRTPALESGWAEIEVGWPKGTPPLAPGTNQSAGPMVGFRKEIAREENLELIPAGTGGGNADLLFQAWDETGLVIQRWQLPLASIATTGSPTRIPEPGDIIRARWEQAGAMLEVRGSYFDASAQRWYIDVINATVNLNALNGVNFNDGAHLASSITSDTEYYSIRRFRVGTLDTYGQELPSQCPATLTPSSASVPFGGGAGTVAVAVSAGCAWTATSQAPWLTITGGADGVGPGATHWSAAANPTTSPRTGTLAIAGRAFDVTQPGVPPGILPTVSVGDLVVAEGDGANTTASFAVMLSAPSAQPVTVGYATADGTALAGSDYLSASGTVTFPPGTTAAAVPVTVLADAAIEPAESFELRLAEPAYATIGDAIGTATIVSAGTTIVGPPTDFAVSAIVDGVVTFRWNGPVSGPAPAAFLLTGGLAPGQTLASLPIDAGHRLIAVRLAPGTYYARLYTQADAGLSVASNEVRVMVNVPAAPASPTGLVGLADGATVTLAWTPSFAGGTALASVLEVSGATTLSLPLGAASAFSFAPVPAGSYTFAVRAANAFGSSPPSSPVTLTFPGACAATPQPPARVAVHRAGRALLVFWDPPATGPAPTSYLVNVSGAFTAAVPTTGRSVGGTVGPGTYGFAVRSVNPCGQSPPSPLQTAAVP